MRTRTTDGKSAMTSICSKPDHFKKEQEPNPEVGIIIKNNNIPK